MPGLPLFSQMGVWIQGHRARRRCRVPLGYRRWCLHPALCMAVCPCGRMGTRGHLSGFRWSDHLAKGASLIPRTGLPRRPTPRPHCLDRTNPGLPLPWVPEKRGSVGQAWPINAGTVCQFWASRGPGGPLLRTSLSSPQDPCFCPVSAQACPRLRHVQGGSSFPVPSPHPQARRVVFSAFDPWTSLDAEGPRPPLCTQ